MIDELGYPVTPERIDDLLRHFQFRSDAEAWQVGLIVGALRSERARLEAEVAALRAAGDWMAECLEDSLVNLAPWEHSVKEDALDAWRALARLEGDGS